MDTYQKGILIGASVAVSVPRRHWKPARVPVIVTMLAFLLLPAFGFAGGTDLDTIAEKGVAPVVVDTNRLIEDEQEQEREHAKRLKRAREEHEARRAEAARKLEAEQARLREIDRLRTAVSNLQRRESFLQHEVLWTQRELDSVSRDPADHSAVARRSGLDRQLFDLRNQLQHSTTSQQGAMKQLHELRFR